MILRRLFGWISLRHLAGQSGRTVVSILGVALGVSVFVAIRLASGSAVRSFKDSVDSLAGKANLQVSGQADGIDEARFAEILRIPGVINAWPVVQALVSNHDNPAQSFLLIGLDFFSDPRVAAAAYGQPGASRSKIISFLVEPDRIALSRPLAEAAGWKRGDRITVSYAGRKTVLRVGMILGGNGITRAYGGDVGLMDIAAAQHSLGLTGKLTRIDIVTGEGRLSEVSEKLRAMYPAASVEPPASRGRRVESMIASFRLNLLALAIVALLVGAFLIFNSISLSVIQRRREIGIARSIGVSRGQILCLFLGEAALYGITGSVLGLGLGIVLAKAALSSVSATVSTMYATVRTTELAVDARTMIIGLLLGMAAALTSGIVPAAEAANTSPGVSSREGSLTQKRRKMLVILAILSVSTACLGAMCAGAALKMKFGALGFASAALLLLASAFAAPIITVALSRLMSFPARLAAGVEGLMAARWMSQSLERTAVVIAALSAAVTMLIALDIMVGSFRQTVQMWMKQTVRADVFVEPASRLNTGEFSALPAEVVDIMDKIPGVAATDALRANKVTVQGKTAELYAIDFAKMRDFSTLLFMQGEAKATIDDAFDSGDILVSETFANRFDKGKGDHVSIVTPSGRREFRIGGVFYDYTSESGLILIHRPQYARIWRDPVINTAALYVKDGFDPEAVRRGLQKRLAGRYDLAIQPNRAIQQKAMDIFDSTFAITNSLKIVAVVIAVLGVLTTMAALILQRRREIGIIRAVGASRLQAARMIVIESVLIGLFGTLIGSLCGPVVAMVLIKVINKLFFGWTIIPVIKPQWFIEAALWIVAASILAGSLPARLASRLALAAVVRDER